MVYPRLPDTNVFLAAVAKRYKINKNAEAGTLMSKLTGMSYNSVDGVRAYILGMIGVRDKLTYFEIPIPNSFCDAPKPGSPLTTRQPAEYSWMSGNPNYS